jgi:Interferon-induced transmembrane protein
MTESSTPQERPQDPVPDPVNAQAADLRPDPVAAVSQTAHRQQDPVPDYPQPPSADPGYAQHAQADPGYTQHAPAADPGYAQHAQAGYGPPRVPYPQPYPSPYPPHGYPGHYGYYPPPPPPGVMPPSNHLAWAIGAIFLFWPVAIAALIKSGQVDRLWEQGQYGPAQQASESTKTLCLVATIIGAALFVLAMVMFFVVFATVSTYGPLPSLR